MKTLTLTLLSVLAFAEDGRISQANIMKYVFDHYINIGPSYKTVTMTILGVIPSDKFINSLDLKGKKYAEYDERLNDDNLVLKIDVYGIEYDEKHEIYTVKVSHRDTGLSGTSREYRYHLDASGEIDRFVFISDKASGRY